MDSIKISLIDDFTRLPGPRYKTQGKNSGEEFFDRIIRDKYSKALNENKKLFIDLDGAYGYPPSFIDESFGRIVKNFKQTPSQVLSNLVIKCDTAPFLERQIEKNMENWYEKYKKEF